jgi:hypothetical protein
MDDTTMSSIPRTMMAQFKHQEKPNLFGFTMHNHMIHGNCHNIPTPSPKPNNFPSVQTNHVNLFTM